MAYAAKSQKKVHIGTSGWSYDHWDGVFYPKISSAKRLSFYSENFSTVEINSSFYHLPTEKSVKNWKKTTPKDFIFSVKASRFITHVKRLKSSDETVKNFIKPIALLKEKLGPILFLLPPSFKLDYERLRSCIDNLPAQYQYTFEFRHPSWFHESVYKLLRKNNIALCISDLNGKTSPEITTADFMYVRLHGPKQAYRNTYSYYKLKQWAIKIKKWEKKQLGVYIYFDNDEKGYAIQDAKRLLRLI